MPHTASMLSDRLVRIIESHAERLTQAAVEAVQSSPLTPSYHRLPFEELFERVYTVYHDLGAWLGEKTEPAVQSWYHALGSRRFDEGIPLAEVLWALVLTKYQLRDHINMAALADSAMELYRQRELDRLIGEFFDRAVCYTAEGYAGRRAQRAGAPGTIPAPRRRGPGAGETVGGQAGDEGEREVANAAGKVPADHAVARGHEQRQRPHG